MVQSCDSYTTYLHAHQLMQHDQKLIRSVDEPLLLQIWASMGWPNQLVDDWGYDSRGIHFILVIATPTTTASTVLLMKAFTTYIVCIHTSTDTTKDMVAYEYLSCHLLSWNTSLVLDSSSSWHPPPPSKRHLLDEKWRRVSGNDSNRSRLILWWRWCSWSYPWILF